ncbi:MAG TPA: L-threonylcarbamoyladenylate synthase [Oligoflexus sp.]|uniref:L-threonylcarbamoyladenylate synthase n=1 Tax=Oligoflexus sp. TaxID=1971216 RepID=UPI002D7E2D12|nr:L-threonylcarbamoyladenylate synthase [Oligoflexus sp.]HET9235635.1 L-threonylcarbamoyladenylate synthase [Oligoflexus sp.]
MTGFPKICMPTPEAIRAAAHALNNAQLVGMPTETVYGLGAAIDQDAALEAVFAYKQRPFEDPLIVHVLTAQDAFSLWNLNAKTRPLVKALVETFWPGPLTLVARAQDGVSRLVRGGGDAVGVRSPAHPVARALLEAAGVPVAAPSANLFGHVSPTRAQHVADDFHDRPLLILDGDRSTIGIESTVLKVDDDGHLRLLRHGAIGEADILDVLKKNNLAASFSSKVPGQIAKKIEGPGQYLRHYAPHTPAWMLSRSESMPAGYETREILTLEAAACLDFAQRFAARRKDFHSYQDLSEDASIEGAARTLFQQLRTFENQTGHQVILLPELDPHQPEQQAVYDRIFRASEGKRAFIMGRELHLS